VRPTLGRFALIQRDGQRCRVLDPLHRGAREWQGDRGTKKEPNVELHRLYAFLTTEPNGVVAPTHDKAIPVMLMTAEDVDVWLNGTLEEALKLQKPRADEEIVITPYDERKAA
jgi:putative SOS response-associated peptidase YedK